MSILRTRTLGSRMEPCILPKHWNDIWKLRREPAVESCCFQHMVLRSTLAPSFDISYTHTQLTADLSDNPEVSAWYLEASARTGVWDLTDWTHNVKKYVGLSGCYLVHALQADVWHAGYCRAFQSSLEGYGVNRHMTSIVLDSQCEKVPYYQSLISHIRTHSLRRARQLPSENQVGI